MNRESHDVPNESADLLQINLKDAIALAIEQWRLATAVNAATRAELVLGGGGKSSVELSGTARLVARRIGDLIARWDLTAVSLEGKPFAAGLAATVVDTQESDQLPPGVQVVTETVSPLILRGGKVVRVAQVVVTQGKQR